MGTRPTAGQAWTRYAVLGDPRPSDGQAWPRYSGPSSGEGLVGVFSWATGDPWPAGTYWGVYSVSTYMLFSVDEQDGGDVLALEATTVEIRVENITCSYQDGSPAGDPFLTTDYIFIENDSGAFPIPTPGSTPWYMYIDMPYVPGAFVLDVWTEFGIPADEVPTDPQANATYPPVYIDFNVDAGPNSYVMRQPCFGYNNYGPFHINSVYMNPQVYGETTTDWIYIENTLDFTPVAIIYQWSPDGGTTWNNFTYQVEQDAFHDPTNPAAPVMIPYDPNSGQLNAILALESGGAYQEGITLLTGLALKVVYVLPGSSPYPDSNTGPTTGFYGPYEFTQVNGPFTIDAYNQGVALP